LSDVVQVLVKKGQRDDGCASIEEYEFVDATSAQAHAYSNNDPAWREAKADTSWLSRLWRRLS
jgi:hypothetical protein